MAKQGEDALRCVVHTVCRMIWWLHRWVLKLVLSHRMFKDMDRGLRLFAVQNTGRVVGRAAEKWWRSEVFKLWDASPQGGGLRAGGQAQRERREVKILREMKVKGACRCWEISWKSVIVAWLLNWLAYRHCQQLELQRRLWHAAHGGY